MINLKNKPFLLTCFMLTCFLIVVKAQLKPTIWKFNKINKIGNYLPVIEGKPQITKSGAFTGISFNGINDGFTIPVIPLTGWQRFTIEILFKPDGDGPREPRFIHFEDKDQNRGTLEIRLTSNKQWYLDVFLKNGKLNKGIALIDSALLHPADHWYWVAMVYDGKTMSSYVNGIKQLETAIDFPPITSGQTAVGMRLNKVNWFKGTISEARFYPQAVTSQLLQSVK